MVNLVAAEKQLLHWVMKQTGLRPQTIEIEHGTTMNIWAPSETTKKAKAQASCKEEKNQKKITKKPAVVLIHGFAAEGILTWQFQVKALTGKYAVYVPDLLFFGGSMTCNMTDRSPEFQAESLVKGLMKLGVDTCTAVGFSYGGFVAFKMADLHPHMVNSLVISGSITAYTDSINAEIMGRLGFSSPLEMLMPTSVEGVKTLFKVALYKKVWIPDRLARDFLQGMFNNRKEKAELLETLVSSSKDVTIPKFPQRIHLLWGEHDQIFNMKIAQGLKEYVHLHVVVKGIKI